MPPAARAAGAAVLSRARPPTRKASRTAPRAVRTPPRAPPPSLEAWRTCRACKARFDPAANTETSCRHHPSLYTGGEVAKAVGFARRSADPAHSLAATLGRTGLLRFWDCCGAVDEAAPGCTLGRHVPFGED